MTPINFDKMVELFPDWKTMFDVVQIDDPVYQRLVCRWDETHLDNKKLPEDKVLNHKVMLCINVITGDIFNDDPRLIILVKHILLFIARPFFMAVKTLWHLSIILPLANEIYKLARYSLMSDIDKLRSEETSWSLVGSHMVESILDIGRTPYYSIAMEAVYLIGIITSCYNPNNLYYTRDWVGKLELELLRKNESIGFVVAWQLNPCFCPKRYKMIHSYNDHLKHKETITKEEFIKTVNFVKALMAEKHVSNLRKSFGWLLGNFFEYKTLFA